ncbi:MAG: hypothetical protein WDO06_00260 [Actinomycetota bacterium]
MSSAFSALIWWLVPIAAVLGALAYVLWVTKFQERFQNETTRSVTQFQKFQSSFKARSEAETPGLIKDPEPKQ